ncbi:MAG: aldo/keto reductase [Candidatus Eremiobacteraeota bacterium]|nr:aldo/keto reductase [Candidatus Eremiobacteraeota bacterium]
MQKKRFGASQTEVAVIGQGTWNVPESGAQLKEAKRAIVRGIELGMTHLDTAEMYGSGRVEEIVGETIASVPRERLFVTTKVLPSNASYRGTLRAADRSLKRLRLEYLDLYLLHWPGGHPLEETMRALEELVEQGKSRYIGVSNFDVDEMMQAASYLRRVPLTCNQVLYNLHERGVEHELIGIAQDRRIAVVAYTPFGRGLLRRNEAGIRALETVAGSHGATVRQVILAFLTRRANVFAIPKAARVSHVEENAAAGELTLEQPEVEAIDRAFPIGARRPLATL